MKIRNIIILTALSLALFCLGACGFLDNSGGQGSIIINFGGAGARYTVTEHDMEQMIYTITLTSPGKKSLEIKTSKGAKSVAIPVSEGAWNIQVKAEGDGNRVTKGKGDANAVVASGKPAPVIVDMKVTGTRVHNWAELTEDFKNTDLAEECSVELVSNIVAESTKYKEGPYLTSGKTIILWSEENVIINRKDNIRTEDTVFTVESGTLILDGTKGGTITIDGNKDKISACSRALINVLTNGTLKMYEGVTLTKNTTENGGGVYVEGANAYFYMYGGAITNNVATSNGGGVYITSGGHFEKTGGVIYGENAERDFRNTVSGSSSYKGHAVYYSNSKYSGDTLNNDATGNISYP